MKNYEEFVLNELEEYKKYNEELQKENKKLKEKYEETRRELIKIENFFRPNEDGRQVYRVDGSNIVVLIDILETQYDHVKKTARHLLEDELMFEEFYKKCIKQEFTNSPGVKYKWIDEYEYYGVFGEEDEERCIYPYCIIESDNTDYEVVEMDGNKWFYTKEEAEKKLIELIKDDLRYLGREE